MELKEIMAALAAELGVEALEPDEGGLFHISVDEMAVSFAEVPETQQVITCADVGEPPPEDRERLYTVLMESMHLGRATGGSTFSLDPETGRLLLFRLDPLPLLDQKAFLAMLEKFVNVLEQWRKLLCEFTAAVPEIAKAEAASAEEARQFDVAGLCGFEGLKG